MNKEPQIHQFDFIVITHLSSKKLEQPQPIQCIPLIRKFNVNLLTILAPMSFLGESFAEETIRGVEIEIYNADKLIFSKIIRLPKVSERFRYPIDLILMTFGLFLGLAKLGRHKKKILIAGSTFDIIPGIIAKRFGRVDKVILYAVDYSNKRFANALLNYLYRLSWRIAVKNMDYFWDGFSHDFWDDVIVKLGGKKDQDIYVPFGHKTYPEIDTRRPRKRSYKIIYGGSLNPAVGVDLAVRAIPILLEKNVKTRLGICGIGSHVMVLKELAKKLKVSDYIEFLGFLFGSDFQKTLIQYDIGLLLYRLDGKMDLYKYLQRPTKVSEYLYCGLPIVSTRVVNIYKDIESHPAGVVVDDNPDDVARGIERLLTDESFYSICQKNAYRLSEGFDSASVLTKAILQSI